MSTILGLHYGHHGSACIVKDGRLVSALSLERLTRRKFDFGVTRELIEYILNASHITMDQIDYLAISDWNRQFSYGLTQVRQAGQGEEIECLWSTIFDNECYELEVNLLGKTYRAFHIGHQFAHAAAAFYTSPFDEAFCFTLDASGGLIKNNSLISYGKGNKLTSLYCPGLMIGVGYGLFTESLGIGPQIAKAGSTMALASYGKVLPIVLDNLDHYINGNFITVESLYHPWHMKLWEELTDKSLNFTRDQSDSIKARNVAASIQFIFEKAILKCVGDIENNGVENICLGGGSMLNCVVNSLILTQSQFKNVSLFPGCGDDGGCVGSALYVSHHLLNEPRTNYENHEICFLGQDHEFIEPDYKYLAEQLSNGKIIAWVDGRSEYGPRALGNRSIFADPRDYKNREKINFSIKHREWYRPLAPIVMEEYLNDWFDFPAKSPFMLFTAPVKQPDRIPAINHVDNSARIQTINERNNPHCYRLTKEFYNLTGVPVLLNTSLNGSDEAIVETEQDALNFFNKSDIDILVLNGTVYEK